MRILYCQNYGQEKTYFITQSQEDSMEKTRFYGQGKTFRLRASNYDENIYSYKSSNLQAQNIRFGKLEFFNLAFNERVILLLNVMDKLFCFSTKWRPHAK